MPASAPAAPLATARSRLVALSLARPVEVEVLAPALELRALEERDREEFVRVVRVSRAHLERFSALHRPGETDDALFDRQLALTRAGEQGAGALRRVGVVREAGRDRIVGAFNLTTISRGLEWAADVAWWVAGDALHRGYGLHGLTMLAEHALGDLPHGLGLYALRAYIQRDNTASVRLAERAGFAKQDDAQSYVQTGDRWVVHDLYVRR